MEPASESARARQAADILHARLEAARRELLDLTARNRLLNTPRRVARTTRLDIVDERSEDIFRLLVNESRAMSFEPRPADDERGAAPDASAMPRTRSAPTPSPSAGAVTDESSPWRTMGDLAGDDVGDLVETPEGVLEQPASHGGAPPPGDPLPHHVDAFLQTTLTSEKLQTRLLRIATEARIFQEEQGVNTLYLALGFLRWYENDASNEPRDAPLLLVPVELSRRSAGSRFQIRWSGDDPATNLSLQVKLREFGLSLPNVPEIDDLSPAAYFDAVRMAIRSQKRWEVLENDAVLWFFSFSKLLMYRDLDPKSWPGERQLEQRPLVRSLLVEGFRHEPPVVPEGERIDRMVPALDTIHVLDADSSQAEVVEEVKRGRNLVVQGPPGTGKSQTIGNIIAAVVHAGKRVLFVAEKMAALEVVKRRLEHIGLGDLCLELHSNKARKRDVLEQLARAMDLARPVLAGVEENARELERTRRTLDEHADAMHTPDTPSMLTPFRAVGELVRLRAEGLPPPDFQLPDAATWSPVDRDERTRHVADLAEHVRAMTSASSGTGVTPVALDSSGTGVSPVATHPWRGVCLDVSLPDDRRRLVPEIESARRVVDQAAAEAGVLAGLLRVTIGGTPGDHHQLAALARRVVAAPREMDAEALTDPVWENQRAAITDLVKQGFVLTDARTRLSGVAAEVAWDADLSEARRNFAATGRSLFRFLSPRYRRAVGALRGVLAGPMPGGFDARLALFDALIAARKARQHIAASADLGARAFGAQWRGEQSDWSLLASIERWDAECLADKTIPRTFRHLPRRVKDRRAVSDAADRVSQATGEATERLGAVFEAVKLDLGAAFGEGLASVTDLPLSEASSRLAQWLTDPDGITRWIGWRLRSWRSDELGVAAMRDRLADGRLAPDHAVDMLQACCCEAALRRMLRARPALASFDGLSHERVLARFRQLDLERLHLARRQVAMEHYRQIPRGEGDIGELGVIKRELNKRRRHLPVRQLLKQAGNAASRLKPVFMMSPMSIAQYLEPGSIFFDVLVIDEASQVRPVEALGAAARAEQMVVVGDDRQLPPTSFFSRTLDDVETDDDAPVAGDLESVLGLCKSCNMSERMLRWHYRSRHHSLIAVSNREFYENRLYVVPSPSDAGPATGVRLHHVADGVYERAGSRTNPVEARRVAEHVIRHAETAPHLTLGVGAFSVQQRDAILDELERLRRARPDLEPFFATGSAEPFFVKNLENIQGDERDVILISVGYGRDASGYMAMSFGPLSNEGGERRLNVLITRARTRCEVFSSITDDDIDLNRATGAGPRAFKAFLRYARTGVLGVETVGGQGHHSPFEESVARAIASQGYQVEPQVGVAGFFIDLAVRDPDQPGRFLLGIECDGAAYHSARSTRDRDRLRQQVLEDRGWRIHRIWSTDWFNRPQEELRRVVAAIEQARVERGRSVEPTSGSTDAVEIEREESPDAEADADDAEGTPAAIAAPYEEAAFTVGTRMAIHEMSPAALSKWVERVVQIESPVHPDIVAQRLAQLWGMQRTGSRIQRAVETAIIVALGRGAIAQDGGFLFRASGGPVAPRTRANVSLASLRKPEMLPPAEIRACLLALIEHHVGASHDEAIRAAARELGFRSTSEGLRLTIEREIAQLVSAGRLREAQGRLYAPPEQDV